MHDEEATDPSALVVGRLGLCSVLCGQRLRSTRLILNLCGCLVRSRIQPPLGNLQRLRGAIQWFVSRRIFQCCGFLVCFRIKPHQRIVIQRRGYNQPHRPIRDLGG